MRNKYFIQRVEFDGKEYTRIYASNDEKSAIVADVTESKDLKEDNEKFKKILGYNFDLELYTGKKREQLYYFQSQNRGLHSTYIYPSKSPDGEYLWEFQSGDKLSHEQIYKKLQRKGYQYFKLIPIEQPTNSISASNFFAFLFLLLLLASIVVGNI